MEASPSRSDSFSHGWLMCKVRPAPSSFERLGVDADAGLGHSFNSSASFIDMDPADLFSMRWTSSAVEEEDDDFDFGLQPCAGAQCSPLLLGAGRIFSDGRLLLPCGPSNVRHDGSTYVDVSPSSSPVFHSAQSTPASMISSRRTGARAGVKARAEPMLATRRILLRYLRFLVPLCRKVTAMPLRVFAPRSRASLAATTTSTSSFASASEYWCHGNADTAVRDAILYCKKSIGQDM